MSNQNCLEGIRCPHCGNEDRFLIVAKVIAEVTADGADLAAPAFGSGFEWDEGSFTCCPQCNRAGALGDFSVDRGAA